MLCRKIDDFDIKARKEWKKRTESREVKTVQNLQKIETKILDSSLGWDKSGIRNLLRHG